MLQYTLIQFHLLFSGSPFHPTVTDRSKIFLLDDLTDQKDENDHLALECDKETVLNYNISEAGPGKPSSSRM